MSNKLIGGMAVAAALCMAAPAWADHGRNHRHGHGHGHGHAYGHSKHSQNHYVRRHYVVREVYRPVPVYQPAVYPVYPAPVAGIHFVLPDIYIPFR